MVKKLKDLEKAFDELQKEFEEYKKQQRKAPVMGEKVEVAGIVWIILDKTETGYIALSAENIARKQFGENNNWKESPLRKYLNGEFKAKIEKEIGCNLPKLKRDLFSLDGQDEYGECEDVVSLITGDEYRKYRKHIPNFDEYWWTCTPHSTKCNADEVCVTVVSPLGNVDWSGCNFGNGVRPFCIFPSVIFES